MYQKTELLKRLKSFISQNRLINSNRIGAAVSGGPDSVFMLYMLNEIAKDFGFKITVLHFNHKIRKESDKDALFVKSLARTLNLDFETESCDVLEFAKKEKLSLEEAARIKRYDFLKRCKDRFDLGEVALAHTKDDVAETFVMNMMRGSSLSGLTSMRIKREFYIRPVCFLKKSEIVEYLDEQGIAFRVDKSNKDTNFVRNKIRLDLMSLMKEFNPNIIDTIFREMDILKQEDDYLNGVAQLAVVKNVVFVGKKAVIDTTHMNNLAIKRRVVSIVCKKLTNSDYSLSFENINRIAALNDSKKSVVLRKLFKAYMKDKQLIIEAL